LAGDAFWVVAAHGWQSDYVRNLAAEPRVRVLVEGAWRRGRARVMPDDDPQWDAAFGRPLATTPVTVRIDLL
jgi:hypothetical protein